MTRSQSRPLDSEEIIELTIIVAAVVCMIGAIVKITLAPAAADGGASLAALQAIVAALPVAALFGVVAAALMAFIAHIDWRHVFERTGAITGMTWMLASGFFSAAFTAGGGGLTALLAALQFALPFAAAIGVIALLALTLGR